MTDPAGPSRRWPIFHRTVALWLFALTIAGIVYGSLYPFVFDFSAAVQARELQTLILGWREPQGYGNMLANLLLFLPYGLFGAVTLSRCRPLTRWIVLFGGGAVIAFGLQVLQLWLPHRVADLADGMINLVGAAIGVGLAALPWRRLTGAGFVPPPSALLPALLLGCWLAALWFPYVPTLDWYTIKQGLKPLLLEPRFEWLALARHAIGWLVFALFWRECRLAEPALFFVVAAALLLQLFIAHNGLSLDAVLGALMAMAMWPLLKRARNPAGPLLCVVLVLVLFQGLWPFEWQRSSFHWIPFHGFLGGSMMGNLLSLLSKLYLYGALVWLVHQASRSLTATLITPVVVTGFVEVAQTRLVGHVPEISDPLLCVLLWSVLWASLRHPQERRRTASDV